MLIRAILCLWNIYYVKRRLSCALVSFYEKVSSLYYATLNFMFCSIALLIQRRYIVCLHFCCNAYFFLPIGCELPCNSNQFQCKNCRCILESDKCNHINDCGDNSDEMDKCSKYTHVFL